MDKKLLNASQSAQCYEQGKKERELMLFHPVDYTSYEFEVSCYAKTRLLSVLKVYNYALEHAHTPTHSHVSTRSDTKNKNPANSQKWVNWMENSCNSTDTTKTRRWFGEVELPKVSCSWVLPTLHEKTTLRSKHVDVCIVLLSAILRFISGQLLSLCWPLCSASTCFYVHVNDVIVYPLFLSQFNWTHD